MESKVIIERQYLEELKRCDEVDELVRHIEDSFLVVAQSIILGRSPERIVDGLVDEGWGRLEAESFVGSVQEDVRYVIDALGAGTAHRAVVDELIERDWSPHAATDVVASLDDLIAATRDAMVEATRARAGETKRRAQTEIGFSALFLITGLSVSLLSSSASVSEGTHLVSWCAMLLGLVGLVAGVVRLTTVYQR